MREHIADLHIVGECRVRRGDGQRDEQMGDHAGQRGKLSHRGMARHVELAETLPGGVTTVAIVDT
ncbi:hypothetical protein GCM10010412_074770 [Nonomuraea recticatena]|uniref:Transposase n=1 Tax=Nonomuraea recticatena TaxID=46178 RepID=A0ABP6F9G0_9ACTN